jgi:hypothetical protein
MIFKLSAWISSSGNNFVPGAFWRSIAQFHGRFNIEAIFGDIFLRICDMFLTGMKILPNLVVLTVLGASPLAWAQDLTVFNDKNESPQTQLTRYLDSIAGKELARRAAGIAAISTREQAARRQQQVRERIARSSAACRSITDR